MKTNSIDSEISKQKFINTYLHIHYPKIQDKPYYKLDLSKNILYLHNQMNFSDSESDGIFEFDKIFTNENDNSFIYQNISNDVIKEAFNGKSFCYISYGNTMSDKFKILIGDNNNKGILLQTLTEINDININNNSNENIKTYLSYFSLYNDKLIDLSNITQMDFDNKQFENDCMKKSVEVNKNYDINNIRKINIDNDIYETIDKLFSKLTEIEHDSKYHIYRTSHFCFIIYIINTNNNDIISTITFILLNGSELLNKNISSKKNEVSTSLISVDSQFIFNSIIYFISVNKSVIHSVNNNSNNIEKDKISKLTGILNNICFNPDKDNIKFIIIGNIIPITGYYETTKDTLMFVFNIRQSVNKNKKKQKRRSTVKKLSNKTRDDVIFDLESKMKFQANTIENLNKVVQKKDLQIFELEKNYKTQVEFLKKYFGFKGKIEVLLSGDVNTKEYKEAEKIRGAKEDALILKRNMDRLEKDLEKKEEQIKRMKNKEDMKQNDQNMIQYYFLAEDIKKNKKIESENKKEFFLQIQAYENEIKNKDKIIIELKKELEQKNKILTSIPKIIKNNLNKKESDSTYRDTTNRYTNRNTNRDEAEEIISVKKDKKPEINEYIEIIKKNKEEYEKLKYKYENILSQYQKKIEEKTSKINDIIKDNKIKFSVFKDELIRFFDIFMNLINSYRKNKDKIILFEKVLSNAEKEINEIYYPNIFKLISTKNKKSFFPINTTEENKKESNNINNELTKEKIEKTVVNFFGESKPTTLQQINDFIKSKNSSIFSYNNNQLEQLSKENLIKDYTEIINYIQTLEKYIHNYGETQENKNKKNIGNIDTISEYEEKIKILRSKLDEETKKNLNYLIVINSQKKEIDNFNFKNIINTSKNKIKDKYPIISSPEYCPTVSGTKYNNNNFSYNRNSSNIRNSTEKNYDSYIGKSTYKSNYNNIFGKSFDKFDKNKSNIMNGNNGVKKRPLSSTSRLNTEKNNHGKHVLFLKGNNYNSSN